MAARPLYPTHDLDWLLEGKPCPRPLPDEVIEAHLGLPEEVLSWVAGGPVPFNLDPVWSCSGDGGSSARVALHARVIALLPPSAAPSPDDERKHDAHLAWCTARGIEPGSYEAYERDYEWVEEWNNQEAERHYEWVDEWNNQEAMDHWDAVYDHREAVRQRFAALRFGRPLRRPERARGGTRVRSRPLRRTRRALSRDGPGDSDPEPEPPLVRPGGAT